MKKGLIGVQMSTLGRAAMENGVYEALKRCNEIGYRCLEFSGVPHNPEQYNDFQRARKDFGYVIAALGAPMTAMFPGMKTLETNYSEIVDVCGELECTMLRIGMGPLDQLSTYEGAMEYCEHLEHYVQKLKKDGIDYYYHTHATDFMKHNGMYVLEMLKKYTEVGFELDTHWIQAGGEDPVKVIKNCAGRIRLLHLKDYRITTVDPDANAAARTNPNAINPQYTAIQFAEIGEGNQDIQACIEAGLEGGSEYFLIEQDRTYDRSPYESLKISHDNLVSMGYADWF